MGDKEAAKRLYTAVLFKDCIAGKAKNEAFFSTTVSLKFQKSTLRPFVSKFGPT